jgi:pyruvate dehydrogenase E1 component alpha subunit
VPEEPQRYLSGTEERNDMQVQKEKLLDLYLHMFKVRTFEEKCVELASQGLAPTNPHLAIGQEASIVGVIDALRKEDYVTATHRGHGHNVARGADLGKLLAEILGRADGFSGGRAGSMHAASPEVNVMGCYPIVGDSISVATGLSLSCKYLKNNRVVVSFFGDGAANIGPFHEGLNLASVWSLPIVYVCENNYYAISTPVSQSTSVSKISARASGYNMPGVTVDGMNVEEVYAVASEAVDRARASGPSLIECLTYRFRGSSEGEPGNPWKLKYRSREELEMWMTKDPVKTTRNKIIDRGISNEDRLSSQENTIRSEVESAAKFAVSSPQPNPTIPGSGR